MPPAAPTRESAPLQWLSLIFCAWVVGMLVSTTLWECFLARGRSFNHFVGPKLIADQMLSLPSLAVSFLAARALCRFSPLLVPNLIFASSAILCLAWWPQWSTQWASPETRLLVVVTMHLSLSAFWLWVRESAPSGRSVLSALVGALTGLSCVLLPPAFMLSPRELLEVLEVILSFSPGFALICALYLRDLNPLLRRERLLRVAGAGALLGFTQSHLLGSFGAGTSFFVGLLLLAIVVSAHALHPDVCRKARMRRAAALIGVVSILFGCAMLFVPFGEASARPRAYEGFQLLGLLLGLGAGLLIVGSICALACYQLAVAVYRRIEPRWNLPSNAPAADPTPAV